MKNIFRTLFAALLIVSAVIPGKAEMVKNVQSGSKGQRAQTAAGCTPSSSYEWLDINNVRTRINSGGDMWWDLPAGTGSKYFIPANGSATSLFAGSLWIAGVDVNNQLKCAALRFRQVGNDYYYPNNTFTITDDLALAVSSAEVIIISISSQALRSFMKELIKQDIRGKKIVLCMKGIELNTGCRLTQIVEEYITDETQVAVWVGPGHPQSFSQGIPNCMVIDSRHDELKKYLISEFSSDLIRFYVGQDLIGNEIGAAAKNSIGIAAGMLDGMNL